jgi:hypothetical protein
MEDFKRETNKQTSPPGRHPAYSHIPVVYHGSLQTLGRRRGMNWPNYGSHPDKFAPIDSDHTGHICLKRTKSERCTIGKRTPTHHVLFRLSYSYTTYLAPFRRARRYRVSSSRAQGGSRSGVAKLPELGNSRNKRYITLHLDTQELSMRCPCAREPSPGGVLSYFVLSLC